MLKKKQLKKRGLIATLNMLKVSLQLLESYMVKQMAYKLTMSFNLLSLRSYSQKANEIGNDLARKIAKGHEAVVYTHADKGHIHNHIVINNVNYENGKKLQLHGQKAIDNTRAISDELCKEQGLSIVKEPTAKVRYTLAEKSIIEKGGVSWKDELRQAIDFEKAHSTSYKDFKQNLTEKYGIEVNDKGKHITYKHPDHEKVVRGNKLGLDYERGTIEHGFSRQIERADGERERSSDQAREQSRTQSTDGANNRVEQAHAELHKGSSERGHHEKADGGKRTGEREKRPVERFRRT